MASPGLEKIKDLSRHEFLSLEERLAAEKAAELLEALQDTVEMTRDLINQHADEEGELLLKRVDHLIKEMDEWTL